MRILISLLLSTLSAGAAEPETIESMASRRQPIANQQVPAESVRFVSISRAGAQNDPYGYLAVVVILDQSRVGAAKISLQDAPQTVASSRTATLCRTAVVTAVLDEALKSMQIQSPPVSLDRLYEIYEGLSSQTIEPPNPVVEEGSSWKPLSRCDVALVEEADGGLWAKPIYISWPEDIHALPSNSEFYEVIDQFNLIRQQLQVHSELKFR